MSDLIVVGFPKVQEAEEVRMELFTIQQEHLISLEDAVVLEHGEDDHVHLRQAINLAAAGAVSGSFWGVLVGLLFLNHLWVQLQEPMQVLLQEPSATSALMISSCGT